jgi:hypothetical protein
MFPPSEFDFGKLAAPRAYINRKPKCVILATQTSFFKKFVKA